ncbi:hypothetical protein HUU53_03020 [Candidatus Micrarchaeota archaeon]|nr:hypothetical protein [Candidatus Micrarchaeota archaeon]
MFKRGQISIEFFLVLSIMITFILIIYSNTQTEINQQRDLNSIVLASSALDSVTNLANFVYLSGPGTRQTREIFIPSSTSETPAKASANCFYVDTGGENRLYCTVVSDYVYNVTDPDYNVNDRSVPIGVDTGPGKQRIFGPELEFNKNLVSFDVSCTQPLGQPPGSAQPGWYKVTASFLTTCGASGSDPCIEYSCEKLAIPGDAG